MKGTILASIPDGAQFCFGGVTFVKLSRAEDDDMVICQIANTMMFIYITSCSWVESLSSIDPE